MKGNRCSDCVFCDACGFYKLGSNHRCKYFYPADADIVEPSPEEQEQAYRDYLLDWRIYTNANDWD